MDEVLKRRLVGGIVLLVVLMAVTFFFFSGGEETAAPGTVEVSVDGTRSYSLDVPVQEQLPPPDTAASQPGTLPPASTAESMTGQTANQGQAVEEISMAAVPGDADEAAVKPAAAAATAEAPSPAVASAPPSAAAETQTVPKAPAAPAKPASKPVAKPQPTAKPAATGGWAIQTGSFASQTNAASAQKKLGALGYRTFISKTEGQNPTLYRVRVGPYTSEAAAKASAAKLREQLKQDVKVIANK